MKVSIITAVRNCVNTIAFTLESVAQQSFPDIEHGLIDGASTDGTLDVVRRNDSRVAVLISERDSGIYDAFNKGLRHATGDMVGFLNAGDRYASEHSIQRLLDATRLHGVDAVFGDLAIVHPQSRAVLRTYRSGGYSARRTSFGYMPAHPTLLVRRSVFERFGVFDTSYRIAGDFEFVARTFGKGLISYTHVPETLVYMDDGGLSNRGWKSKWAITKEMHRACRSNGLPSSWLRLLLRLPLKYLAEVRGKD